MKIVALAFAMLILQSSLSIAQVTVSLPTITGQAGTTVALPVTVGSLSGQNVYSYQFTMAFDSSVVKITSVTTAGTISNNMQLFYNIISGDTLKVAASGTSALSGSGTLVNINVQLVSTGTSPLTLQNFQFNEGTPAVTLTNGSVGVPKLAVAIPADTGRVGSTVLVPINTNSLAGQTIYSFQFSLVFDPTMLSGVGVSTSNTLSSSMQIITNIVPGGAVDTLKVAAAGSTALTGQGVLIYVTGRIAKTGTSALSLSSFQYNEGSPSVGTISGSITGITNYRPHFTAVGPKTVMQLDSLSFTVTATDSNNDVISYSASGLPTGATFNDSTHTFSWRPSYMQLGLYNVTFKATDPYGAYDSMVVPITVTIRYVQPTILSYRPAKLPDSVGSGSSMTFGVTVQQVNPYDTLSYTWTVNGVVQSSHDSTLTITLPNTRGNVTVKVVVTDKGGLTATQTWSFLVTAVEEKASLPTKFGLDQNYPNPFNPTTVISFDVPKPSAVRIVVYDILGKEVRTLVNNTMSPGTYHVTWDGLNDEGRQVSSGIYFYRMEAGSFVSMKKMLLLK